MKWITLTLLLLLMSVCVQAQMVPPDSASTTFATPQPGLDIVPGIRFSPSCFKPGDTIEVLCQWYNAADHSPCSSLSLPKLECTTVYTPIDPKVICLERIGKKGLKYKVKIEGKGAEALSYTIHATVGRQPYEWRGVKPVGIYKRVLPAHLHIGL